MDLATLRRRVDALGPSSRCRRYPDELRAALCAAAITLRGEGRTVADVTAMLGVPWETLFRWLRSMPTRGAAGRPTFRTVEIAPATSPTVPDSPGLVIYGPCGLRIEVRDVAALAALLRCLQ